MSVPDFRQPVRVAEYDSNATYYPRELSVDEVNKLLYIRSSDNTSDIILNLAGHTPVKGVDYFTPEDQEEMANAISKKLEVVQITTWEADD